MNIRAVEGIGASAIAKSSELFGPDEFLRLLIAELKMQDPLNPFNPQEMVAQLSTMQMVAENRLARQQQRFIQALQLLGRHIVWQEEQTGSTLSGEVTAIWREGDSLCVLVNDTAVPLEAIKFVR